MKILIPTVVLTVALLGGAAAGYSVSGSPVPADLVAPVSASPVEGDDAPAAVAPVDAGPANGIGTSPVVIPDPVDDPGAFGGLALDAARSGKLALLAIFVLLGLSRGAIYAADRWPAKMGWAGGKMRPWLVMSVGVLGTAATSLATLGRVDLSALAGVIAGAIALELKAAPPPRPSLGGGK